MSDLGTIIADARSEVAVLKRMGNPQQAAYVESLLDRITEASEDFLTWLSEDKARMKSGLSYRTLRRRFRELLDCGLARYGVHHQREYRSIAIPRRAEITTLREAGRTGEAAA